MLNENILSVILVESVSALEQLDTIVKCDNIDVIYIGTYDLSHSLGVNDNLDDPKLLEYLETAIKKIRDAGKYAGVLAQNKKDLERWKKLGVQFIPYQVDCGLILTMLKDKVQEIREVLE
jgi:2-keto-3-deoxy-L-rhamnonate aldolase RhmA